MPLLGQLIYSAIAGFVGWLVKYVSQKMAVAIAITAVMSGLLIALYLLLRTTVNAALTGAASMHPMFAAGVAVVISPTSQQFISAYLVLWSACELYKWKFSIVHLWSRTI
jgi:uncharacterized protein (DUF2342 family)